MTASAWLRGLAVAVLLCSIPYSAGCSRDSTSDGGIDSGANGCPSTAPADSQPCGVMNRNCGFAASARSYVMCSCGSATWSCVENTCPRLSDDAPAYNPAGLRCTQGDTCKNTLGEFDYTCRCPSPEGVWFCCQYRGPLCPNATSSRQVNGSPCCTAGSCVFSDGVCSCDQSADPHWRCSAPDAGAHDGG